MLFPGVYLYTASKLPQLETEFDLETQLRTVGGGGAPQHPGGHRYDTENATDHVRAARLQPACRGTWSRSIRLPAGLSDLLRVTPRGGRALGLADVQGTGVGRRARGRRDCERHLALRITSVFGIKGALDRTVAANKIHAFLQKDQLVAYDLDDLTSRAGRRGEGRRVEHSTGRS